MAETARMAVFQPGAMLIRVALANVCGTLRVR